MGEAGHALRAGLLDCRGGTWLGSRQAGALLIIMSGLQVSRRTVGGGGGGVDNRRADKEKKNGVFKKDDAKTCVQVLFKK